MNVPRHVIIDLLPLYFEEEVSEDTRKWIETYLENDPELFAVVQQTRSARVPANIPLPVNKETEMEAFKKVKRLMVQHNLFLVAAILTTFLTGMAYLFVSDDTPAAPFVLLALAAFFWVGFYLINRQFDA